jgi:hypothetical protein
VALLSTLHVAFPNKFVTNQKRQAVICLSDVFFPTLISKAALKKCIVDDNPFAV